MSGCCCQPSKNDQTGSACCGSQPRPRTNHDITREDFFLGWREMASGRVAQVTHRLSRGDKLGAVRVRLGIGRMSYSIPDGLYTVGAPDASSPVLVTANYKLSFDRLRQELEGINAWILVLDTQGINVWCAAGKGTFGSAEIVRQVGKTGLAEIVRHRQLIVPQLGAPGVSAHEVKRQCGFSVVYGPVRAEDLPAFLKAGLRATPEMRRVRFGLWDRLVVVPVEVAIWFKAAVLLMLGLTLLSGLQVDGYSAAKAIGHAPEILAGVGGAYLTGAAVVPVLLPWLPGRAFALKGAVAGVVLSGLMLLCPAFGGPGLVAGGWVLLTTAVTSFMAMNFTGTSTYTSMSGVKREMRLAVPLQAVAALAAVGLWIAARIKGV